MDILEITEAARLTALEIVDKARMTEGQLLIVGCSTSEVRGFAPGTNSGPELGRAILDGIMPVCSDRGIVLAAQCCEHLNRALVIDSGAAVKSGYEPVNAVPRPEAGGSFASALYSSLENPVVVERVRAHAGLDIGGVLIGMHLREAAVPLRLESRHIGEAIVLAARTRPKYIGGERAHYDERLK